MANTFKRDWSDKELEAAVDAYIEMLEYEKGGKPYSKTEINKALREKGEPLEGRTKSSVEYRMQNISAVLMDAGLPVVKGYAPAANVGEGIRAKIWKIWVDRNEKA
jgi:5-methylcytosine-specific restriction enzyme A